MCLSGVMKWKIKRFNSMKVCLWACVFIPMNVCKWQNVSGVIMSAESLRHENRKSFSYLSCAHSGMPLSPLPQLSSHSLIISKVNILYCDIVFLSSSRTTTFEKLKVSIVTPVSVCLFLLVCPFSLCLFHSCFPLSLRVERLVLLHCVYGLL